MSNLWNHLLCRACYGTVEPGREPIVVPDEDREVTPCCRCGDDTRSGIFYRRQPDAFPCGGVIGYHAEATP